jgi:hypothetical protein
MKHVIIAMLASVGAVTASVPASAVTFGQPDGNAHPFVGTILFKTVDGYFSCTATLMSPTVLLTAGHCTSSGGVPNLRTWATFAPTISLAGIRDYPSIDEYFDDPVNGWVSGTSTPHPQFDDYAEFPKTYDIGVVVLDTATPMGTYAELPPIDFLTTIRRAPDNKFTVVGYGMQGLIPAFYSDIYARYNGQLKLHELKSTLNSGMSAKFSNNPGTGGGTCYGDSGGPIFYGATNMVVAVVSFGTTPCIGIDFNFRADIPLAQDFLEPFLE